MKHRLKNELQFIELVQQLTEAQQQQVLLRLKDLSEQKQVSGYKRSPLLDPRQIIP